MINGHFVANKLIVRNNNCLDLSFAPTCALFVNGGGDESTVSISNSVFYNNNAFAIILILNVDNVSSSINSDIINNTFYNNSGTPLVFANAVDGATISGNVINNTFANNNFDTNTVPFPLPAGVSSAISFDASIGVPDYQGNLNIKNNIFYHNTVNSTTPANCEDPSILDSYSTIISQGGNISDDNTCASYLTATDDKNNTNSQLGTLSEDNNTWVLPLLSNSPAIDNAIAGGLTPSTDQRGEVRPQGLSPDSGAYELADQISNPGLPNTGANLARTGEDMKLLAIIAIVLVSSGVSAAAYLLMKR